jgi:hypothetical protein
VPNDASLIEDAFRDALDCFAGSNQTSLVFVFFDQSKLRNELGSINDRSPQLLRIASLIGNHLSISRFETTTTTTTANPFSNSICSPVNSIFSGTFDLARNEPPCFCRDATTTTNRERVEHFVARFKPAVDERGAEAAVVRIGRASTLPAPPICD